LTLGPPVRTVDTMRARFAAGVLFVTLLAAAPAGGVALAQSPPAAASVQAGAGVAAVRGAIVVAVGDDASPAARALALEVYRDAGLRPAIDEATARVLAGGAPAAGAPAKLQEIADLRGSIARARDGVASDPKPLAGSEVISRRLLDSLATELGAGLVVAVSIKDGRPVARVLRRGAAAFEPTELGATTETAADGTSSIHWAGSIAFLSALAPAPPVPAPPPAEPTTGALKPLATPLAPTPWLAPAEAKPIWKSLWFWGALAGVAAVGVGVFAISKATQSSDNVHLQGTVGP
jgi:hypothetical protein